jgi:hypothetical protein
VILETFSEQQQHYFKARNLIFAAENRNVVSILRGQSDDEKAPEEFYAARGGLGASN